MFKNKFRQNIRLKFLSIIAGILVIGTVVLSITIAISVRQMLGHSLMSKGQGLASYLAKISLDPLIMKDYLELDSFVNDANKDEDIIYIIIQDAQGTIITSQFSSVNYRSPRLTSILSLLPKGSELPDIIAAVNKERTVMQLSAPILTGKDAIGRVTVCISKQQIYREMIKTIIFIIALNLVVTFVLGTVLFVASRKTILDPIVKLSRATDDLAQGDLSTRVNIKAEGEIRMLVDSFNKMAADLEKTTVSRNYMDEIISSMSDALIVLAPDRTITRVNTAASSLLEYNESELVGRPMDSVLLDEEGVENGTLALVLEQNFKSINSVERTYRAKSWKKIPVLFSASVMHGINGEIEGVVCVARDITELKKAEEKLKQSAQETREMYDELRAFTYIASHDLRAPLVNIKGFTKEFLYGIGEVRQAFDKILENVEEEQRKKLRQVIEKEIPEALKFIDLSASRMDMLINAILKLSRTDNRKIVRELIHTEDMVRGILNTMAQQIGSRGISVTIEKLPDLVTDRIVVEQIFGNLLDNAIKYLDPGRQGEIALTAELGDWLAIFHVRDNGRGMATEDIPRAFESFRRIGKQDVPGEGMGLAYVKTSIRKLGGRIWCESEPGIGTTFSFSLPLRRDEDAGEQPREREPIITKEKI